jgi:hypothetical protein
VPEEPNKENRLCVSNIDLKDDGAVHAGWADLEMMVESKRTRNNRTDSSDSEHHRTAASPSVKLQDFVSLVGHDTTRRSVVPVRRPPPSTLAGSLTSTFDAV